LPEGNNTDRVKIFVLPTLMTAGNLFCGYQAVITIATGKFAPLEVFEAYAHYRRGSWRRSCSIFSMGWWPAW
jgi:hypothetical protein